MINGNSGKNGVVSLICNRCGCNLPMGHPGYLVKMVIMADYDGYVDDSDDTDESVKNLIDMAENYTNEELDEQVIGHYYFRLCNSCRETLLTWIKGSDHYHYH